MNNNTTVNSKYKKTGVLCVLFSLFTVLSVLCFLQEKLILNLTGVILLFIALLILLAAIQSFRSVSLKDFLSKRQALLLKKLSDSK